MALMIGATMGFGLLVGAPAAALKPMRHSSAYMGLHTLTAKGMDGTEVELKSLAGSKVIAVNVASK